MRRRRCPRRSRRAGNTAAWVQAAPVPQFERTPVIAPLPPVFSFNGVAGAQVVTLSESMKRSLDLPAGVLVTTVPIGSPAAQSGLEEGDVILRVGQEAVATVRDLRELVARAASEGERSVTLELRRGKDRRTLTLRWRQN
jgi:serine protease Do